jgi:hypothetical protein
MPRYALGRTAHLVVPLTRQEERNLERWAAQFERTPVAQLKWLLRDVLVGQPAGGELAPMRRSARREIRIQQAHVPGLVAAAGLPADTSPD